MNPMLSRRAGLVGAGKLLTLGAMGFADGARMDLHGFGSAQ